VPLRQEAVTLLRLRRVAGGLSISAARGQPLDEPGTDGYQPGRPRAGDPFPVITGQTGLNAIFRGRRDHQSAG